MENGFYVNETTRFVDGDGWHTRFFVHYNSPYRLGCYICECSGPRQAKALAAALNAVLNMTGR